MHAAHHPLLSHSSALELLHMLRPLCLVQALFARRPRPVREPRTGANSELRRTLLAHRSHCTAPSTSWFPVALHRRLHTFCAAPPALLHGSSDDLNV